VKSSRSLSNNSLRAPIWSEIQDRTRSIVRAKLDRPLFVQPHNWTRTAILLDVDGTILDIAQIFDDVHVSKSLCETLRQVSVRVGGALALVSGRRLSELDDLFAPLRLPSIGGHGAEIRVGDCRTYERRAPPPLDQTLKARILEIAKRYPGVIIEDKGYSIALHYRLAPEFELHVIRDVFRISNYLDPESYELLFGKAVIEVKAIGFSRGSAVRELMSHSPFVGRKPIFVGDDIADESAFAVMPEFNGLAMSVGRKLPGIIATFQTPSDVRQWLERISDNLVPCS
jgi:trehalose 6-phosphate phosphatase